MIVLNMKISPFYLLDPFCPCLRKRAISFAAACALRTIRAVQNPSRKTTRSRSIPGDFDTGKTQDPPRGRHTFCVLGAILRFAQRKKYNHISLILYARGANVNWSKPRICFAIQSVYHYILCHYRGKTKINTKYRFCKSDVRKILPDECTTI